VAGRGARSRVGAVAALLAALLGALLLGGCGLGGADDRGSSPPDPDQLNPDTVALVTHVPDGNGTITQGDLDRAIDQAAAQEGQRKAPAPGEKGYDRLASTALGELLDSVWLRGQAAAMGIDVSGSQIDRELAQIKREDFKSGDSYEDFVRESHFSDEDVRVRVELQILSAEIKQRLGEEATSREGKREAFKGFVAAYMKRWRGRTACQPTLVIERCSNGPELKQ
jgi:hypothetical protein